MDNDLARHVAMTAFRSSASLNDLIPLLKHYCSDEEYQIYLEAISAISGDIAWKILKKIYDEHPDIKRDIDYRIDKYGRLISG